MVVWTKLKRRLLCEVQLDTRPVFLGNGFPAAFTVSSGSSLHTNTNLSIRKLDDMNVQDPQLKASLKYHLIPEAKLNVHLG